MSKHSTDVRGISDHRMGLVILTYCPASSPQLGLRLRHLMSSLQASGFPGIVTIVDDASDDAEHVEYLRELQASKWCSVICRSRRGGISTAKNTCLRVLVRDSVDFGFLIEDDMELHDDWWRPYMAAHTTTGIAHFSWSSHEYFAWVRKQPHRVNGVVVVEHSDLNGCLLTFTQPLLQKVGGFVKLPQPWGAEHNHYTDRCVRAGFAPYYVDVLGSNHFVRFGPHAATSFVQGSDRQAMAARNATVLLKHTSVLESLDD